MSPIKYRNYMTPSGIKNLDNTTQVYNAFRNYQNEIRQQLGASLRPQAIQGIQGHSQQALAANTSEHIAPIPHNDNLSVEWKRGGWFRDAGYYVKHRTIRTRKAGPHQSVAAALDFCKNEYRAYPREVILQPNL